MNDAILIQQAYSNDIENAGYFTDMLRLTFQRHASYARAHKMDFWCVLGDLIPTRNVTTGAWHKIEMIKTALDNGYKYAFWLDTDAAIVSDEDLRGAFSGEGDIGCCLHDANKIPAHLNVGVVFVRNSEKSREFFKEWSDAFPGERQWAEQGVFNKMVGDEKWKDVVFRMDDRYNATVNVNMVDSPVVMGWHGTYPIKNRFQQMKQRFYEDHVKFRV